MRVNSEVHCEHGSIDLVHFFVKDICEQLAPITALALHLTLPNRKSSFSSYAITNSLNRAFETIHGWITLSTEERKWDSLKRHVQNIEEIHFVGYNFESFPSQIVGKIFKNVESLHILENEKLEDVHSLVNQFPKLSWLILCNCRNFTDLGSIANVSKSRLSLQRLYIIRCGVSFQSLNEKNNIDINNSTRDDQYWTKTFTALPNLQELVINECPNLISLPMSLHCLSESLRKLTLGRNVNLKSFEVIGSLTSLESFNLYSNSSICALPSTMHLLPENCRLFIYENPKLIRPPANFIISIQGINRYRKFWILIRGITHLVILFRKAKQRANDRLFRPTGSGYIECKSRFNKNKNKYDELRNY